jgi:hypothetical protein
MRIGASTANENRHRMNYESGQIPQPTARKGDETFEDIAGRGLDDGDDLDCGRGGSSSRSSAVLVGATAAAVA